MLLIFSETNSLDIPKILEIHEIYSPQRKGTLRYCVTCCSSYLYYSHICSQVVGHSFCGSMVDVCNSQIHFICKLLISKVTRFEKNHLPCTIILLDLINTNSNYFKYCISRRKTNVCMHFVTFLYVQCHSDATYVILTLYLFSILLVYSNYQHLCVYESEN